MPKKAKVALLFAQGTHTSLCDLVPDVPGLVIHKVRVWEEGEPKPHSPSWAKWTVTHIKTGRRATPLPLPNREAAEQYALTTHQLGVKWEEEDPINEEAKKKCWKTWNAVARLHPWNPPPQSAESSST